ncbi:BZ3500_MvSof-1268-A1-R1_Chr8-2g10127 [Microbotryum saponariae]|uniref:BZ3500_MvSof-1268-A1-R1_Chr8-2g10127 protein n=1 Tax=Microbotryum saponariae TaxID=289078 RepID=A0A2X0L8A5_9BASI|nr:BZ3500_MvSof-1268-A1-R1_Chr8-2g10127 [Microbotryum saponariae]SDA01839.1 BZ3501_MvSof-1269-A2-R1_Chr8-2g09878 [Microbotryum saponariae]
MSLLNSVFYATTFPFDQFRFRYAHHLRQTQPSEGRSSIPQEPLPPINMAVPIAPSSTVAFRTPSSLSSTPTPAPHWSMQDMRSRQERSSSKKNGGGELKSIRRMFSSFGLQNSPAKHSRIATRDISAPSFIASPATATYAEGTISLQQKKKVTIAEQVIYASRKIVQTIRRKLSSKTPANELPKTWEEYSKAYAKYEIDIEDPPLPPVREVTDAADPTPFEAKSYMAPKPYNESERQAVVDKLDLFATKNKQANASTSTLAISMPASTSTSATNSRPVSAGPDSLLRRHSYGNTSVTSAATSFMPPDIESESAAAVTSLQNYPAFRDIVQRCQKLFGVRVGMLTVLDEEQQLFLATGGLPEAVEQGGALPRAVTFCSHAILNEERGMVVLDSLNDWRFANSLPTSALGARFYAGVPLLAPTFGDPDAPNVAIGTLCAVDDRPRADFSENERAELQKLAVEASTHIETWVNERMGMKLTRLKSSFARSTATLPAPAEVEAEGETPVETAPEPEAGEPAVARQVETEAQVTPESESEIAFEDALAEPSIPVEQARFENSAPNFAPAEPAHLAAPARLVARPPRAEHRPRPTAVFQSSPQVSLPLTPPDSLKGSRNHGYTHAHARKGSDSSSSMSSFTSDRPVARRPSGFNTLSLAVTSEDPVTAVPKDLQKVFDQATRMLAKALALDLVYLVSLDVAALNSGTNTHSALRVLSAYGMPSPPPTFDPALHLKALRAPEGGMLYSNPRYSPEDAGPGYSGGLLIPVLEVRRTGYVLSGYSKDATRNFEQKDLTYFVRFSEQLETYVTKLGRVSGSQIAVGL